MVAISIRLPNVPPRGIKLYLKGIVAKAEVRHRTPPIRPPACIRAAQIERIWRPLAREKQS